MKFHEILRQRRLALGLTQEQLAQRLGVSAPAVNKWERNNSYPDITLLPPLARLLEVDLNTLLSFQEELTEEEIGAFANVLGERAQQEGCEAAFRLARDKLREYPNSDLLAYTAAQILDGALVLWKRGENDPEREQAWKGEILALYRRCADSGDRRVRERAERMLISQYMAQGELEQAEEQLARLPQEDRERPMLEAMLRRKQKRSEEAWPILERELFRQASDLQSTLMALMDLALEAGDKTCARQYSETAEQAGRVFQLTAYAVASAPLHQALAAQAGGADYLGVGAVFSTGTKTDAVEVGPETLRAICDAVDIPVIAIGGVSSGNVHELEGSGICGIAVVSAIFAQDDIQAAAADLKSKVSMIADSKGGQR